MTEALPDGDDTRRRTPIIALTAHALSEVRERCLAAGMDDFLVKPFDDRQLAGILSRWLAPGQHSNVLESDAAAAVSAPAETPPARSGVIDLPVIEGLRTLDRKGGRSRLARAVGCFADIAPPLAATMRDTFKSGDTDALWRAAHSLKSSAGALGAKQLSQRCAEIESHARGERLEEVRPLIGILDDDLTAVIDELQALIGEAHVPA